MKTNIKVRKALISISDDFKRNRKYEKLSPTDQNFLYFLEKIINHPAIFKNTYLTEEHSHDRT